VAQLSGFSDVDRSENPDRLVAYLDATARSSGWMKQHLLGLIDPQPGELVLDVGCGAGHDLAALAATGAGAVGVDRSAVMATESRRRLPAALVAVGEGSDLPFRSTWFHAVRVERVLQHVADAEAVLRECRRVARAGGRIVVYEPDWGSLMIDSRDPDTSAVFARSLMATHARPRVGLELRRLVAEAGFVDVQCSVDVGQYSSLDVLGSFLRIDRVLDRAIAMDLVTPERAAQWRVEMTDRSEAGSFWATLTRTIAVGRA